MTNIQAIDLLKGLEQRLLDDYCGLNDEGKNAFHMAITALEVFGNPEQLGKYEYHYDSLTVSGIVQKHEIDVQLLVLSTVTDGTMP
jgi:hypothetical protein